MTIKEQQAARERVLRELLTAGVGVSVEIEYEFWAHQAVRELEHEGRLAITKRTLNGTALAIALTLAEGELDEARRNLERALSDLAVERELHGFTQLALDACRRGEPNVHVSNTHAPQPKP